MRLEDYEALHAFLICQSTIFESANSGITRFLQIDLLAMDYDATTIPAGYDRGRNLAPDVLELWMETVAHHVGGFPVATLLDLGCGTGRFTDALATRFAATAVGVDPSHRMIEQARRKRHRGRAHYVRGSGETLPLADMSVDLIFMSMVFHHFGRPDAVARECQRVARNDASVIVRAGTTEQIPSYPYVEFIPEAKPLLYERLNTKRDITGTFEAAGFETVASDLVAQQVAATHAAYVEKLAAGGDSILASLSARELKGFVPF